MKKLKALFIVISLIGVDSVQAYSYTFTNKTPYRLTLNVCAATCNCQNKTIEPNESTTFEYGPCCLDYLRILSAEIYDVPQTRPGWGGKLDIPTTGFNLLCADYAASIHLENNEFVLKSN